MQAQLERSEIADPFYDGNSAMWQALSDLREVRSASAAADAALAADKAESQGSIFARIVGAIGRGPAERAHEAARAAAEARIDEIRENLENWIDERVVARLAGNESHALARAARDAAIADVRQGEGWVNRLAEAGSAVDEAVYAAKETTAFYGGGGGQAGLALYKSFLSNQKAEAAAGATSLAMQEVPFFPDSDYLTASHSKGWHVFAEISRLDFALGLRHELERARGPTEEALNGRRAAFEAAEERLATLEAPVRQAILERLPAELRELAAPHLPVGVEDASRRPGLAAQEDELEDELPSPRPW